MIKFDQVRFGGDGSVTLRASANTSEGLIEVARSNISACHRPVDAQRCDRNGHKRQNDRQGDKHEHRYSSSHRNRPGGVCLSKANTINAPTQQICP